MFILQLQYGGGDSSQEPEHFGMRNRKKGMADVASQDALAVFVDNMAAEMLSPRQVERDSVADNFASTLTPGAQNAIHAASFAWGYENATRYLKNAMKLEEVKNADNAVEKSKAVIESMSAQAGQNEKTSEVSKFVWGYYNEDLKDTQAQAGKSESLSEKSKVGDAQKEQDEQQLQVRQSLQSPSAEAVGNSICAGTLSPTLIYCAEAHQEAEYAQEQREEGQKREELARLITPERMQAARGGTSPDKAVTLAAETERIALARRDEELKEFEKAERSLDEAIKTLDHLPGGDKNAAKKIASMLPAELARFIIINEKRLAKRRDLRAQLSKWAAFSSSGRKALHAMPASRLIKLVSLSSFLKLGK